MDKISKILGIGKDQSTGEFMGEGNSSSRS